MCVCEREKGVGVEGERGGENTHNAPIAVPDWLPVPSNLVSVVLVQGA
jgi:hypothetical protein